MVDDSSSEGSDISKADLHLVEYKQAGEAFRSQGALLNRSYYLSAIVFTFLAGTVANFVLTGPLWIAALLSFVGVPAFVVLGASAAAYHRRRETASNYRQRLTNEINGNFDGEPLKLQPNIAGGSDDVSKRTAEYPLNRLYRGLYGAALFFSLTGSILLTWWICQQTLNSTV